MSDRTGRITPAKSGVAITPGDSGSGAGNGEVVLCRALWIGGAGDIYVDFRNGDLNVGIIGVAAGSLLPFDVKRVYATSTTATSIVAVY